MQLNKVSKVAVNHRQGTRKPQFTAAAKSLNLFDFHFIGIEREVARNRRNLW